MEIALILIAILACVILPAYLHFANKRKAKRPIDEEQRRAEQEK